MSMSRGFPRPVFQVTECQTNRTWNDTTSRYDFGGYGEKWDNKSYPMPYTAEEASISTLHSGRLEECITDRLCIACGEAVVTDVVSLLLKDGEIQNESGPFHSKCARLTAAMCPHINTDPAWSFVERRWSEVADQILQMNG